MLRVGITGGIGSGKTTVCRMFELLGIPVYYADERARVLMVTDPYLITAIISIFGEKAYHKDGSLNRAYIADIVFNDPDKLDALNAIVHPAVFKDGELWQDSFRNVPYSLKEAALLFESDSYRFLEKIIMVYAPEEVRIARVMKRDSASREAVLARISRQWSDESKLKLSDYVIKNDGTKSLVRQVYELHKQLSKLSS